MPNETQWFLVLLSVNAAGKTIPNYYVFKGREDFIAFCEDGACMEMQDNDYMDVENFSKWMEFFCIIMKVKETYHLPREW